VQELLAATLPPLSWMPLAPAAKAAPSVLVRLPPQLLLTLSGDATVSAPPAGAEAGKTSLNATPVNAVSAGLFSKKLRVDLAPGAMELGANDLTMLGVSCTAKLALAALASRPPNKPLMLVLVLV
jgi:hypothetical protein